MSDNGVHSDGDVLEVEVLDGRARASVRTHSGATLPGSAGKAALGRAWLVTAERLVDSDPETAAIAARRGLAELGHEYLDPTDTSTDDDTETKVLGADATDDPRHRATLLARSLEARLQMYQWRYRDLGVSFDPPLESA